MRVGGGAQKGAAWERQCAKDLSLALSGGKRSDFFWRSAMSGGRATIVNRRGHGPRNSAQIGDLCAVDPGGQWLTDTFFIECKFRKDLDLDSFLLEGIGSLARYWAVAQREALSHNRLPLLFARENRRDAMVVVHKPNTYGFFYHPALADGTLDAPRQEALAIQPNVILRDGTAIFWYTDVIAAIASMYERNRRPTRERLRR